MEISIIYTEKVKKFIQEYLYEKDPFKLFLKLQSKVDFDLKLAVNQLTSRQKSLKKLPNWANNLSLFFPVNLSVEQASSEETASFKAELIEGKSMMDLTGGFGIDTFHMGAHFKSVSYCERDKDLVDIFRYNMDVLGMSHFKTYHGDGLAILAGSSEQFDLIYVDPARRGAQNQKLYNLADCEPDVSTHWQFLKTKAKSILIKVSPMLDLKKALTELPDIREVWVLSVKNEVKEVLLLWQRDQNLPEPRIHCVDLGTAGRKEFTFSFQEEVAALSAFSPVKSYIIEPMASIMKAGAFHLFGQQYGLEKLHANSHLYTTDIYLEEIPGRIFKVIREFQQPKKEIKTTFPSGKVNVIARNFALSAEEIKKKFKLKDGGEDFLIWTKVGDNFKVFHARKLI
nr:class I SAM-dependent methyltransferase [Cecembia sp.]